MDDIITNLCQRLKSNDYDIRRLKRAKAAQNFLIRKNTFSRLLGEHDELSEVSSLPSNSVFHYTEDTDVEIDDVAEEAEKDDVENICMQLPEDKWQGYFDGFEILVDPAGTDLRNNRKCIELTQKNCNQTISHYLRCGIRCFMIDLSRCRQSDNQALILHLRESELRVSKEYGFPIVSTIVARITSRYQYTGYLEDPDGCIKLIKGKRIILTTDRRHSTQCNQRIIYVNARFLLADVKEFDIIPIGQEIQLMVKSNLVTQLDCCVSRGGILKSHMPVLFPKRCPKFKISLEELEDITFAKEVGINVIISDIYGSIPYIENLNKIMRLLQSDHMRLFARVVMNEIQGCEKDMNWVTERYDGFLVEVAPPAIGEDTPDIMRLCPAAECFMQMVYNAKKPIILDPTPIAEQKLRIDPAHYFYTFYYPDKYVIRCQKAKSSFYFSFLQDAIFDTIPPIVLPKLPYCDLSHTGVDTMARAAVAASFEMHAAAIIITGVTTRMAEKVSHFRPNVPIILVTHTLSAEDYVMIYHNVIMLPFHYCCRANYKRETYKKVLFAIAFLIGRKMLKDTEHLIIIYNQEKTTIFPDKYLTYKFDAKHFAEHLAKSMFIDGFVS